MSTEIATEKFATVPLFVGLDQTEIMKLMKLGPNVAARKGEVVVRQGEPGDGIYVIAAGAFEVRKKGAQEKVLARLEQLSFFGEMSLVSDEPRAASVVCVEDGRLKKIPLDKFRQLLDANDLTAYRVIRNMSRILAQRLSGIADRFVG